jgi:hypothetical protein
MTSMAQTIERSATEARSEREKAVKILAKSIYRELKNQGHDANAVVALSTELLNLLTDELRPDSAK